MTTAAIDTGRRRFLRGLRSGGSPSIRPPWTTDDRIADACTRCGACIQACPENVLRIGDGGFPQFDPAAADAACTFCGQCAQGCPEPVFDRDLMPPWRVRARVVASDCLAHAGIHCEICRDACPERAIAFVRHPGLAPAPVIAADACTGCGACLGPCPVSALALGVADLAGRTA